MPKKNRNPSTRIVDDIEWERVGNTFDVIVTFPRPTDLIRGDVDEVADGLKARFGNQLLDVSDLRPLTTNRKKWCFKGTLKGTTKNETSGEEIIVVIETKKPGKRATAKKAKKTAKAATKKKAAKAKVVKKKTAKKKGTKRGT